MTKEELRNLLDAEVRLWTAKPYQQLRDELADVVASQRGQDDGFHQFEVEMIEREETYVHVIVSIDDGSFRRAFSPLTRGFIVHRDGRIEL